MWTRGKNFAGRGCVTPPTRRPEPRRSPLSERKTTRRTGDSFHVIHKVPAGDSPYVKAKRVQLIDKDYVMKQLNRSDEAIEAIKSFRHLCLADSQESLDNVLIELYKRSGRIEEEIQMLREKLRNIEERKSYSGGRFKTARSQGRKVQVTADEERSRIMGNLAWAYIQMNDFETAEKLYREALCLNPDKNKQCNLAICLMHLNKVPEAWALLNAIWSSSSSLDEEMDEAHMKSFERALEMLKELEGKRSEAPDHFAAPVSRELSVSRMISDRTGREEEMLVVNEEKRRASPFETPPQGRSSAAHEATPARRAGNSAPRIPDRRNNSSPLSGHQEGSHERMRNGSPSQPSRSIPPLSEHNRYSILRSPEQFVPHGLSCAGVVGRCSFGNDSRTQEENSADEVGKTKEDLLEYWSVGDKAKKSWADIAEEEEEQEEEEDHFDDECENMDDNIMLPNPQSQMNLNLSQRMALFSLEESRNVSVCRSLKFELNEPCNGEGKDGLSSSYDCKYSLEAEIQKQRRQRPRKRLPVFRDITRIHYTA